MKRLLVIILGFIAVFSMNVSAEDLTTEEFLKNQGEMAGVDKLEDALPEDSKEYFEEKKIVAGENEWINRIGVGNIIKNLWNTAKEKATAPFTSAMLILAVILINGAITAHQNSVSATTANFAVTAASAAIITVPLMAVINSAVTVMQSAAGFMTAFVPVFAIIVAANGQAATSVSMSSLLLGATQAVDLIANHFVIPLMCGYLSVSVASGVSPLLSKTAFGESIKKLSYWVMSLITTVFLGVLSIQTTINASADSLTMRTARFVIGSSVPVAGTVLSEALTTVTASLGILKTSVAIYGVVACCIIFLPLLVELILWRICLIVTSLAADILSSTNISRLLRSIDTAISVLCGIILLSMALFVISLTVVVSVGKV